MGSSLTGSFALHPFNKLLTLFPLAVLFPIWAWSEKTTTTVILLVFVSAVFLVADVTLIAAIQRFKPREEEDILEFLLALFPGRSSRIS